MPEFMASVLWFLLCFVYVLHFKVNSSNNQSSSSMEPEAIETFFKGFCELWIPNFGLLAKPLYDRLKGVFCLGVGQRVPGQI